MIRLLAAMAEFAGMWWEWNPPGREPYASGWHASGTMEADAKTDTNEE